MRRALEAEERRRREERLLARMREDERAEYERRKREEEEQRARAEELERWVCADKGRTLGKAVTCYLKCIEEPGLRTARASKRFMRTRTSCTPTDCAMSLQAKSLCRLTESLHSHGTRRRCRVAFCHIASQGAQRDAQGHRTLNCITLCLFPLHRTPNDTPLRVASLQTAAGGGGCAEDGGGAPPGGGAAPEAARARGASPFQPRPPRRGRTPRPQARDHPRLRLLLLRAAQVPRAADSRVRGAEEEAGALVWMQRTQRGEFVFFAWRNLVVTPLTLNGIVTKSVQAVKNVRQAGFPA